MLAKFIGKDDSMGFKNGVTYEIKSKCMNDVIIIKTMDGKLWCPYKSIESFIENWDISEN